ncbi:MAG: DNA polymerase III subunit epsilon [Alphaproteobacteria bacterium]
MREIILDTETTGLSPAHGDRMVEIACVELINHLPTGRVYHKYLNPEREVSKEAYAVHGLDYRFLKDHPLFSEISQEFLEFISNSPLVIHNADFDMKFLNAELGKRLENPVVDTLPMARKKFPGSPASLDALCRRFQIDNKDRTLHGALIDCHLLSAVYLELKGGRQAGFALSSETQPQQNVEDILSLYKDKVFRKPRNFSV